MADKSRIEETEATTPSRAGEGTNSNGHPHGCQCPLCGNR